MREEPRCNDDELCADPAAVGQNRGLRSVASRLDRRDATLTQTSGRQNGARPHDHRAIRDTELVDPGAIDDDAALEVDGRGARRAVADHGIEYAERAETIDLCSDDLLGSKLVRRLRGSVEDGHGIAEIGGDLGREAAPEATADDYNVDVGRRVTTWCNVASFRHVSRLY